MPAEPFVRDSWVDDRVAHAASEAQAQAVEQSKPYLGAMRMLRLVDSRPECSDEL